MNLKREPGLGLPASTSVRIKPGEVYTTFHHPETGANIVTAEYCH